ncbi:hypothetical protein BKA70DRAFT_1336987 [Coprinopsis sp. MPI-PUGE-AT-0042]|nr:hypothetical protein BKA70DRAFT_1336987 [Coprinopsis sp. MPI-PUGE-AT-0042]
MAANNGHERVVRLLLEVPGIEITIASTKDGHTAMSAALANGHDAIVQLLRDFEARDNQPPGAATASDQLSREGEEGWIDGSDSDDGELFEDALDTF